VRGEVVWYFVYDAGGRIDLDRLPDVLGGEKGLPAVELAKAAPKYVTLPRPVLLSFPELPIVTTLGAPMFVVVKLYDVGAVSLAFRMPFAETGLADLAKFATVRVIHEGSTVTLPEFARSFFERILASLQSVLLDRYEIRTGPEEYTVFCVKEHEIPASQLLRDPHHRARLAALLADEPRADRLAKNEVDDNLSAWFTYYEDDLVVLDWDNAFVYDPSGRYDDVLLVIELANVQLLELRVYDRYLDRILEKAYDDLGRYFEGSLLATPRPVLKDLADSRVDLTRMIDLVENIGKLFGDYYLAKIYRSLTERFHIPKWQTVVESKLNTLNELYLMASQEVQGRRTIALEAAIVLLFVLDLILILLTLH